MNIEQSILDHIREVAAPSDTPITRDTGLLETGVLDSINLVGLIQFIEEHFAIRIPDGDIGSELFTSPATLTAYVERRLAVGAAAKATA
jgi:acyl carrier protein